MLNKRVINQEMREKLQPIVLLKLTNVGDRGVIERLWATPACANNKSKFVDYRFQ
jgi:hypothetical protein